MQIHWHRSLNEVPDDLPTVYIAHEFLDALPVHQFQKTERGWCERLVDVASDDSPLHFRLVLAPGPTPASKLLVDRRLAALSFDQSELSKVHCLLARGFVGRPTYSVQPPHLQVGLSTMHDVQDYHAVVVSPVLCSTGFMHVCRSILVECRSSAIAYWPRHDMLANQRSCSALCMLTTKYHCFCCMLLPASLVYTNVVEVQVS